MENQKEQEPDSFYYCVKCKKVYQDKSKDLLHNGSLIDFKQIPKRVLQDYTIEGFLGEGSYGVVLKIKNIVDKNFYALKLIKKENDAEMHIMKDINHPNIICYRNTYQDDNGDLAVIMEMADETLSEVLKQRKLKEDEIVIYLNQICKAIKYLHRTHYKTIIHCDLKPHNILIKNGQIKLTDFGVSHIKQNNCEILSVVKEDFGTIYYLAPEVLEDYYNQRELKCNEKTDIWSLGVIIYKMLFNDTHPFEGKDSNSMVSNVRHDNKNWDFSKLGNPGFKDLIENCMEHNQDKRWNILNVISKLKEIASAFQMVSKVKSPSEFRKTIYYDNGNVYEGEIQNNMKNGKGKLTFKITGDIYEGNFIDDQREGYGIYVYNKVLQKYEGYWKNDLKHGQGKFFYSNDDIYDGEFKYGRRHGKGIYHYRKAGDRYEGEWKHDKKHGIGQFFYHLGDKYEGEFENDLKHGKGMYYYASDGSKYEGEWENDLRNGEGRLFEKQGKEIDKGKWINNYKINF